MDGCDRGSDGVSVILERPDGQELTVKCRCQDNASEIVVPSLEHGCSGR